MFHTRHQLSGIRKRKSDLEARLADIKDDEIYEESTYLDERVIPDDELNDAYRHDLSRRGKAALKARSGIYRIRPGPKSTLSIKAKVNREKRKARGLKVTS